MSENPSPKFSDIVGALVASVAHARSVADIEALRIAYRYRENELLKGMPVPRLRFRKVSISLPVILTDLIPGRPAEINPTHVIESKTKDALVEGIARLAVTLKRDAGLANPPDDEKRRSARCFRLLKFVEDGHYSDRFGQEFSKKLTEAFLGLQAHEGGNPPSDALIQLAVGEAAEFAFQGLFDEVTFLYIQERVREEGGEFDAERARQDKKALNEDEILLGLKESIRLAAADAAIGKATVPPDFTVTVNTDHVKNAGGGPDSVTRLSMVLMEEGLEWVCETRHDGTESNKLIPE
jgi:hypothetical protein